MSYERLYTRVALEAVSEHLMLLPLDVQRHVKLALSVSNTHGMATSEEMRLELGDNWVLARRTKGIVERYGEDAKCYSKRQYHEAEIRAIEKRVP